MVCPVMCRADSENKNEMTCATSSGSATRPRGLLRPALAFPSGVLMSHDLNKRVLMMPGRMQFTRIPSRPKASANDLVICANPAFDAA